MRWDPYVKATESLPPHSLLIESLKYLSSRNTALDLGAGGLRDTRYLLQQGFSVVAVDSDESLLERTKSLDSVTPVISTFEAFEYGVERFDLINAAYALPFSPPETIKKILESITDALKPGGIFVGQFFGPKDSWAERDGMNFLTKEQIETMLASLEIRTLLEEERDGTTALGKEKHWHVFHVIAQKPL